MSSEGRIGSTSPLTRVNRQMYPEAVQRLAKVDHRNNPASMLTAHMPEAIHQGSMMTDFQDAKPRNTIQSSINHDDVNPRPSSTVGDGPMDSLLAFTKMTQHESISEMAKGDNQDLQTSSFHEQNPMSTLKQSDLGPTQTQDARQDPNVHAELAAHCLSNLGSVEPQQTAPTPIKTLSDNEELKVKEEKITSQKSSAFKVPTGAMDLRDKYKEHLMKRFDTKIIRKREARKRGDNMDEEEEEEEE